MNRYLLLLSLTCLLNLQASAQGGDAVNPADSTGLPGDNFSLEGAVELFKESTSMEDFEQRLNTEANDVNNLDLDQNGEVDYVMVTDHAEGTVHAIVLQVAVNESEMQDVAVLELEKDGAESAVIQILGDEELYGESTILEPIEVGVKGNTPSGRGPAAPAYSTQFVVVNVWSWPSVRFVYAPAYRPYVSPWGYRRHPGWFRPWRVHPWRWHRAHCARFRAHHHVVHTHRVVVAHKVYTPHRRTSVVVVTHNRGPRDRYRATHVHVVHPAPGPRGGKQGGPKGGKQGPKGGRGR